MRPTDIEIAQLYEICKEIEEYLKTAEDPEEALIDLEERVVDRLIGSVFLEFIVHRLFDCLEERLLPLLFPNIQLDGDNGQAASTLQSTTPIIQQSQVMPQQQSLSLQPSVQQNTNPTITTVPNPTIPTVNKIR